MIVHKSFWTNIENDNTQESLKYLYLAGILSGAGMRWDGKDGAHVLGLIEDKRLESGRINNF